MKDDIWEKGETYAFTATPKEITFISNNSSKKVIISGKDMITGEDIEEEVILSEEPTEVDFHIKSITINNND